MSALNRLGSPPERAIDWASRAEAEAFTKDAQRAEAEARAEATPTAEQAAIEGREESVTTERPRPFCVLDSAAVTLPLHCRYIAVTLPLFLTRRARCGCRRRCMRWCYAASRVCCTASSCRCRSCCRPLHYRYITVTLPLH